MIKRIVKTLYISSLLLLVTSCTLNGKTPKPNADGEPRFGKVTLQYTDTTQNVNKILIYRLDTF